MQQVQLQVADEVKAVADAMALLITDIKAKKSATQILTDTLPGIMTAVEGLGAMSADLKKVDDQVYLIKSLLGALEPAPVVAPA